MRSSDKLDKLVSAIHEARAEILPVGKSGYNKFDNYKYAKEIDWFSAVQPSLSKYGLILTSSVEKDEIEKRKTKQGKEEEFIRVFGGGRIMHISGQWIEGDAIGEGQDRADKAASKAQTCLRKNLYALLLMIPTSDDSEADEYVGVDEPRDGKPLTRLQKGELYNSIEKTIEPSKLSKAISEIEATRSYKSFAEVRDRITKEKIAWTEDEVAKLTEVVTRRANCLAGTLCKMMSELPTIEALDESRAKIEAADYYEADHKAEILNAIKRQQTALEEALDVGSI